MFNFYYIVHFVTVAMANVFPASCAEIFDQHLELSSYVNDPLFVHNSKNVSASLVREPLIGIKIFVTWKKVM